MPHPKANSSPVGGWTICNGHSSPCNFFAFGPTGHCGSLFLGMFVSFWKSSWQTVNHTDFNREWLLKWFDELTVTKVCGAKAEKYCDAATIATFVFQVIRSVFWTDLCARDVWTSATHQLFGVIFLSEFLITSNLSTVIGFVALTAHVVRVLVHRELCHIFRARIFDSFVMQSHQSLSFDIVLQSHNRLQNVI